MARNISALQEMEFEGKSADAVIGGVPIGGDFSRGEVGAQSSFSQQPGSNLEGVADLINQAADESIARLGKGREREQQQLLQGFTGRGLRRSGLASGAAADLSQQALQQQRSIERQRLGELAKLGEEAIRARSAARARRGGGGGTGRVSRQGGRRGSIFGATQDFQREPTDDPSIFDQDQGGGDQQQGGLVEPEVEAGEFGPSGIGDEGQLDPTIFPDITGASQEGFA